MDEDLLALLITHCFLSAILLLIFWQTKRKKRDATIYLIVIGFYTAIIIFTTLRFLNVFGKLVATDGFVIGMYSFFGGALLTIIAIFGFVIQVLTKKS